LTVGLIVALILGMSSNGSVRAADGPLRIVVVGDSLAAGYELAAKDAFPAKLEAALKAKGHAVVIENAGVSGDTTSGGLARVDWAVQHGTDGVILELGANDMLRGLDPKIARAALDSIITQLKARGVEVLLCGMRAAPNLGADYVRAFDAIYPELAQKHGLILYPFFLEGVTTQKQFTMPDGLHPRPPGVDVMVAGILPQAEEFVGRLRAKRK
jgi:acyl-CoA thioesterase-1